MYYMPSVVLTLGPVRAAVKSASGRPLRHQVGVIKPVRLELAVAASAAAAAAKAPDHHRPDSGQLCRCFDEQDLYIQCAVLCSAQASGCDLLFWRWRLRYLATERGLLLQQRGGCEAGGKGWDRPSGGPTAAGVWQLSGHGKAPRLR